MTTPIEDVKAQIGALDQRLAREHQENRETLKDLKQDQREALKGLATEVQALTEKVDTVISVGVRQGEQIKVIHRVGGGAISTILAALGGTILLVLKKILGL